VGFRPLHESANYFNSVARFGENGKVGVGRVSGSDGFKLNYKASANDLGCSLERVELHTGL
jgi:hypothetical protein